MIHNNVSLTDEEIEIILKAIDFAVDDGYIEWNDMVENLQDKLEDKA